MISIIVTSKTLEMGKRALPEATVPFFSEKTGVLVSHMKTLRPEDLERLMKISPKLAELNHQRYQDFTMPVTPENACPALLAFKGDVYRGMDTDHYRDQEFDFAQAHLRILSGLYGLLRPLDLIQPYRLEMGTRLAGPWGRNLYDFWADRITDRIREDIKNSGGDPVLVNLASNEYVQAVRIKELNTGLLNIHFKEKKKGAFKVISIHAKRARGLMADFIIKNGINETRALKTFCLGGYRFNPELSQDSDWVFSR